MPSQITSLFIPHVETYVNAQYIIDSFSKKDIVTVSKILIIPNLYPSKYSEETYNIVYLEIEAWHDTEASYSFIKSLRNKSAETRFTHTGTNWWIVKINQEPWMLQNPNAITAKVGIKEDCEYKSEEMDMWNEIAEQLFDTKNYQELELELCL